MNQNLLLIITFETLRSTSTDMNSPITEENSPRSSSIGSSPGGSSTSSKHSSHTLEQSNTISYDLVAQNLRSEPPRKRLKTDENKSETALTVSYTHLTLPTNREV